MPFVSKDTNKGIIINSVDELQKAREVALKLTNNDSVSIQDLIFSEKLEDVETGIKKLNTISETLWLLSAITLYSLVYNEDMYKQSGLMWSDYVAQSKQRLGMSKIELSRQLSSARFFIKYYDKLEKKGWTPFESKIKLAQAELALELSGNINDVINHLIKDSYADFTAWYSQFKLLPAQTSKDYWVRSDIEIKNKKIKVNGIEPVTINSELSAEDKALLEKSIVQIFDALKNGYKPAIIPVYDDKEEKRVLILRDKARSEK